MYRIDNKNPNQYSKSLNSWKRKQELDRIERENISVLKRLGKFSNKISIQMILVWESHVSRELYYQLFIDYNWKKKTKWVALKISRRFQDDKNEKVVRFFVTLQLEMNLAMSSWLVLGTYGKAYYLVIFVGLYSVHFERNPARFLFPIILKK